MLKKSNLFLDSFRKCELHAPKKTTIPTEACSLGEATTTLIADERIGQIFIARGYSDHDDIDSMSSGNMSPDLSSTWHQGRPLGPQWEGGLELNFDNDWEDGIEYEDDGSYEEFDSDAEKGAKDYISEVRESSLWVSLRDCLTLADVLVLRTAGSKWNNAKLYGAFVALWFFLMTKGGGW